VFEEPDRGFRGWLVWFFWTSLLSIAFGIYFIIDDVRAIVEWWQSDDPAAKVWIGALCLNAAVVAGFCIASVVGLILFARGDRRTPAFWTIYFACTLLTTPALTLMFAIITVRTDPLSDAGSLPLDWDRGLWLAVIVNASWLLYWARSRRVYLTYGTVGAGWFRFPPSLPTDPEPPSALEASP
jgi:hypothetical protein